MSPLGEAFSTRFDRTAQGYQEEGVIKLLKDIRDGLAGGNRLNNRPYNDEIDGNDDDDGDDDDDDDEDDDDYDDDDDNGNDEDDDDEDGGNDNDDENKNKICNMLNNMEAEMHDFDRKVKDKEHNLNVNLNKLNNNVIN